MFGSAFGGALAPGATPAEDVKVDVGCTLLEFYHGCVKMVVYRKQTLALDGHTIREGGEECVKQVVIKPGQSAGAQLLFKGEGNEQYRRPSTDLVLTLVDEATEAGDSPTVLATKRKGNDLIYTCKITLQQALKAEPASIETLDGRILRVAVDHIVTPKTVIKIDGEGMPILPKGDVRVDPLDPPQRGDLYVKFDIKFPSKLSDGHRQRIEAILTGK